MSKQQFVFRRWRWLFTDGWVAFPAIFALLFWIAAVQSLLSPDDYVTNRLAAFSFLGVPALVLSAVTLVIYKVRLRSARALMKSGMVVVATVISNRDLLATKPPARELVYEYRFDDHRHSRRLLYVPVNKAAYKLRLFVLDRSRARSRFRDDNGWILSLGPGDTFHVLVNPRKPHKSQVLRLWMDSSIYSG